uniref:Ovule protein n=1 Tax=Romanomermis culicivorax TaxID=13658 RepID=A0A915J2C9_ROMCU
MKKQLESVTATMSKQLTWWILEVRKMKWRIWKSTMRLSVLSRCRENLTFGTEYQYSNTSQNDAKIYDRKKN